MNKQTLIEQNLRDIEFTREWDSLRRIKEMKKEEERLELLRKVGECL